MSLFLRWRLGVIKVALNINEIAKQTLIALKERGLKPTPENYAEIFEEFAQKGGFSSGSKEKIQKYQALLLPHFQREMQDKSVRTLEQFLTFVIALLNRQSGKQFGEFFELLSTVMRVLQSSKDKKIRDLARVSAARISKTMDSEAIYLLDKKFKELEESYKSATFDKKLAAFGLNKYDDYESIIKRLLDELDERSYGHFAELLEPCLQPSLTEDLKIKDFADHMRHNPAMLTKAHFKSELEGFVSRRVMVDNAYVEKNLNFFDENLRKIDALYLLLSQQNHQNMDLIHALKPDEKGEVRLNFEDLKARFRDLGEKLSSLQAQIQFAQNLEAREDYSVVKELERLDENFHKYKVNYAIALFSITNYRFIMEKYGLGNLNEIFVRFKKILKENCGELDELWMLDEKSYLIIAPGRDREQMAALVERGVGSIENFRFIYKQDVITPKISVSYLDKQSLPDGSILENLLREMESTDA